MQAWLRPQYSTHLELMYTVSMVFYVAPHYWNYIWCLLRCLINRISSTFIEHLTTSTTTFKIASLLPRWIHGWPSRTHFQTVRKTSTTQTPPKQLLVQSRKASRTLKWTSSWLKWQAWWFTTTRMIHSSWLQKHCSLKEARRASTVTSSDPASKLRTPAATRRESCRLRWRISTRNGDREDLKMANN